MKNYTETQNYTQTSTTLKTRCLTKCKRVVEQVQRTKDRLFSEYSARGYAHTLRLALNEAEALAWETDFPHLVFPELAVEKVQNLRNWTQHQRVILNGRPAFALAA